MQLTSFILSLENRQETGANGEATTILANPLALLRPPAVPGAFSFTMTFAVSGLDVSDRHKLKILLYDPDGNELNAKVDCDLPNPPNTVPYDPAPLEYKGCVINIGFGNLFFPKAGWYRATITIDGAESFERSFAVYQGVSL